MVDFIHNLKVITDQIVENLLVIIVEAMSKDQMVDINYYMGFIVRNLMVGLRLFHKDFDFIAMVIMA